ncbi:MAG: DUF3060 domain-containing protein [Sphingobium sp.]
MPRTAFAALAVLALLPATAAQAQIAFQGAGQRNAVECDGESVHLQGADNRLAISGACKSLVVEGAGNEITIALAPQSTIRVQGAGNRIAWTAPGTARPKVAISGADNRVWRAK